MRLLDMRFNSPSELQAVFGFSHPRTANIALTVSLETDGDDREKAFGEIVRIVEVVRYCHDYEHCSECSWRQFLAIVSRCRESVPVTYRPRAITIKIRDRIIEDIAAEDIFRERNSSYLEVGMQGAPAKVRAALPN